MKKKSIVLLACAAALFAMGFAWGGKTCLAAKPSALKVKENKIVNASDKTVVLKGVSTHGIAWYPDYVNKQCFKSFKKMGANTIRLAFYSDDSAGYDKELYSKVDEGVKAATDLGMYVIIDWHILSDGNPLRHQSQAKKFFQEMGKKYASYDNVLFEICNEPNGGDGNWTNIRKYAKQIIRTIRKVNKKAIIIVGTPTWSQDVDVAAQKPLTGKNIAYAFHFYAATHKEDLRKKLTGAVKKGLPILVTEFGISEASGNGKVSISQGNRWMRLLNKYKIGRVCWNLSNKAENSALLKNSCGRVSGWKSSDFTKQGRWLWKQY